MSYSRVVRIAVIWLSVASLCRAASLTVRYDDQGLTQLRYGDAVLFNAEQWKKTPRVHVQALRIEAPDDERGYQQIWTPKPTASAFDVKTRQLRQIYDWGELHLVYKSNASRLDMELTLVNRGDKTILNAPVHLLPLDLPHVPANTKTFARRKLGVQLLEHTACAIGLRGMAFYPHGEKPLRIEGPSPPKDAFHPVVEDHWFGKPGDPLKPGTQKTYQCSLVVGPATAKAEDLFPDIYEEHAQQRPMTLRWDDRRPIAAVFLCNPHTGSKTNPRGWFQGNKKIDITTEAGIEVFDQRLSDYADNCIARMKEMDSQGVIVWDIEGQEMPHAISYIGDPRHIDRLAPEMHRHADAFMKKFTDAGFKTGITIRPTEIFRTEKNRWGWNHREVANPVANMADKIRYAHQRWGCTIFYLDSSVFSQSYIKGMQKPRNVPWIMPVKMLRQLHEQFPDYLIIPEFASRDAHAYTAPYGHGNLGQGGTPAHIRSIWPKSFKVVAVREQLMATRWNAYVREVADGDVLMFHPWYAARINDYVQAVYREAGYLNQGQPTGGTPLEWATAQTSSMRYHGAAALDPHKSNEHQQLIGLLRDEDLIVRRQALAMLSKGPPITDKPLLEQLLTYFKGDRRNRTSAILRTDAGRALATAGDAAVPLVLPLLETRTLRLETVRLLGRSGTRSPVVLSKLREIIIDTELPYNLREAAVRAVGELGMTEAVPALIDTLAERERSSESLRSAAIVALGNLGDTRAIDPIVNQLAARYSTVVTYRIEREIDEALRKLTGVQGVIGRGEWQKWAIKNRP